MGSKAEANSPISSAAEDVLLAVSLVPAGRVVSYGDLAALVGTSPRRVGAILRDHGRGVPWWRVVNHRGDHPLIAAATPYWQTEGIPVTPSGRGCRVSDHRADLAALATAWESARTDLREPENRLR